jgi:GTP pyrophosphokinase
MEMSERFREALVYASYLHARQLRKGAGIPYIAHLLAVAAIVLEAGGSEDEAIAALLHDAVEDQGGALVLRSIRERFGEPVADIVLGCTDADVFPKPEWRARKEAYIAHLATATPAVLLVSSADKLHNARAILADYRVHGESTWDRFHGGRGGTLWYYRSLVDAFRSVGSSCIVEELARVVDELEMLAGAAVSS